ncbi:MAG: Recombination endonuclease [Acidimicrobiaceae bacterium]|jgi:hypothetical protein
MLCFNCNGGLGQFGDSVERLRMAIAYLERAACDETLPIVKRVDRRRRKQDGDSLF